MLSRWSCKCSVLAHSPRKHDTRRIELREPQATHAAASGPLFLGERIEVPGSSDVNRVIRDGWRRRHALAQSGVRGHYLRLLGIDAQDRHRAILQARDIDVSVGGDR